MERSYYVCSRQVDHAWEMAVAIRGHWAVENNLHWVKDANLGEDDMTTTGPELAAILAYLNNVTINVLTNAGLKPTRDTMAKLSNKVHELVKLFK